MNFKKLKTKSEKLKTKVQSDTAVSSPRRRGSRQ